MPPLRILRERHRRPWQRGGVMVAIALIVLAFAVLGLAWHMGGPVPVKPVAITLPTVEVGSSAAQGASAQGKDTKSGDASNRAAG